MKKIIVVAGDKSGDLYGGLLCQKLKKLYPSTETFSFGGEHLAAHSHQIINLLSHSVYGLVEVLSSLRNILAIFRQTLEEIEKLQPDLIILIDFPDFNLRLAKVLNKKYPVFYYVSPQIWAWRKKKRLALIRKYVDMIIPIFRFEENIYKKEGIPVRYFGHPLLEIIENKNVQPKKAISFLPGSRKNEIKHHLPVMKETKKILEKQLQGYSFRIIKPDNINASFYEQFSPGMEIIPHSYESLRESEFIITASGTATVEIAILGVPFVIICKVNPITWYIAKKIVRTKYVGMVNILAGNGIVEELLQKEATAEGIAKRTLEYLRNREKYLRIKNDLEKIKELLIPYNATENFAGFIGEYLKLQKS